MQCHSNRKAAVVLCLALPAAAVVAPCALGGAALPDRPVLADEVVLPPPDNKDMALADHRFSIRIRSKQLR